MTGTRPSRALHSAGADGEASRSHTLSVLRWSDERSVAVALAQSFVDDPLVIAICEAAPALREQRMLWSFRIAVRTHCLAAQPAWLIADADGTAMGAVLVTRPRATGPGISDLLFTTRALWHVGTHTVMRGMRAAQTIAAHAPRGPFTYLRTIGVHPAAQGRGLGSQLVEQVIRAAPPSLPVYLETAKERNLSFYAHHGFACIGEFSCLGVPVWRCMRAVA